MQKLCVTAYVGVCAMMRWSVKWLVLCGLCVKVLNGTVRTAGMILHPRACVGLRYMVYDIWYIL